MKSVDSESLYVIILFFTTFMLCAAVWAVSKAARPPEEIVDELEQPISAHSIHKLCQRLERERSIDPGRQS